MSTQIRVKTEWQELTEEDRSDINKLDKYLNELLSQQKVSANNNELIIEYMLGKAHLAKFIALRLNSQSTSKATNKKRILSLIHQFILQKTSDRKQALLQYLEEYLCAIYVNIFKEYSNDTLNKEKFKAMRLFWVEKVSPAIIEKIRKEIGDLFYIDIDTGISAENLALLEKHYANNNINVNTYLKKAKDEILAQQASQSSTSLQQSGVQQQSTQIKKRPVEKSQSGSAATTTPTAAQKMASSSISSATAGTSDERKKPQIKKPTIEGSSIPKKAPVGSNPSAASSSDGTSSIAKSSSTSKSASTLRDTPTKQQASSVISNTPVSQSSLLASSSSAAEENDIQIKKKIKRPPPPAPTAQPLTAQKLALTATSAGQATSTASSQVSTPIKAASNDHTIPGSNPSKKLKPSTNLHPSTAGGQLSLSEQKAIQKQQMADKALKIAEESKNFMTNSGLVLMPTTLSLSYGEKAETQPQSSAGKISSSSAGNPIKEPSTRPESASISSQKDNSSSEQPSALQKLIQPSSSSQQQSSKHSSHQHQQGSSHSQQNQHSNQNSHQQNTHRSHHNQSHAHQHNNHPQQQQQQQNTTAQLSGSQQYASLQSQSSQQQYLNPAGPGQAVKSFLQDTLGNLPQNVLSSAPSQQVLLQQQQQQFPSRPMSSQQQFTHPPGALPQEQDRLYPNPNLQAPLLQPLPPPLSTSQQLANMRNDLPNQQGGHPIIPQQQAHPQAQQYSRETSKQSLQQQQLLQPIPQFIGGMSIASSSNNTNPSGLSLSLGSLLQPTPSQPNRNRPPGTTYPPEMMVPPQQQQPQPYGQMNPQQQQQQQGPSSLHLSQQGMDLEGPPGNMYQAQPIMRRNPNMQPQMQQQQFPPYYHQQQQPQSQQQQQQQQQLLPPAQQIQFRQPPQFNTNNSMQQQQQVQLPPLPLQQQQRIPQQPQSSFPGHQTLVPPPPPIPSAPQNQEKWNLFFEVFNFARPALAARQIFLPQIERMKQNKETYIHPQLFLSRNEESIAISRSGIYDSAPNQCSHCGIRFITCETLRAHLKDHTAKNLKAIEAKREKEKEKKNRPLFNDLNSWVEGQEEDEEKEQDTQPNTEKTYYVQQDKVKDAKCELCQEPFFLAWNGDTEEWVYENARRFEIFETSSGNSRIATVHLNCYKVLEKQSELENIDEEEVTQNAQAHQEITDA